jgi:serine/threonine protein kinase
MSGFVYKVKVGGQILIKKEIPSPETIEEFLYEINALNSLGYSENVINFHGVVVDEYDEYVKGLLISYADGGALIDVIYDNCKDPNGRGLGWEVRERWARQIVQGLADIHESGFVQGDFTLSNIVVDHKDDAKIIDINRRGCPVGWEPPEATPLLESNHRISMYIGIKSDLYQLGMVLWALAMEEDEPDLEGRPLFLGPEVKVPDWYRQLTETCLSPDPRRRLQASQLTHMFPPEANRRDQASADDVASTGSYYADDYTVGRAASERTQYDPRYLPAGAQAYEPWNYAPRGRSPPSPLPSNPDLSESHRSVTSPTAWAAHRFIRSSYSDAGVDDVRNDDINQTLTPTPTADRIEFPAGELCIESDDADAPNEDPLADATPTEAKDIVSSKYQVPEVSADILATTTADTGGIDNDLSKTTVAHEAKSSEADLLDEGQIGAESVVDLSETSGPLTEISPNIVSKDIPQEVEVLASKDSDEPVVDKQPAAHLDEAAVATSSSAEDIIPSVPTSSTPTNGTSGAADTIDVTDKEKPQPEEDGQIVTIDGPKSDGSVEVEAPAKETAAEAPTEPTDETSPVDEPKDSATEVDIAKDEIQDKDVQDEPATVANTLVNEVIPDQETAVEREVEKGVVDDPSKDLTPDAAEDSNSANSASEEPAASPDASKANDVPLESSPDNNQAQTEPTKVEASPADDKEEKTPDHNNEETEHASSKEEVQDPSDPPINPEPEALKEVIQEEEKVAEIKDVLSTETETQPQEPADMRDPPEPATVANVDGQEEQSSEKVTAPDDTVPVEPKTTEAEAQSTKDDDTATSEDTVIVAKDVEPISVPPQDTDHTNVDATVSVQPTKSDLPDSLTGAGSGQPDIQPNLASQDDTILEEDFQVVSRSEPVST